MFYFSKALKVERDKKAFIPVCEESFIDKQFIISIITTICQKGFTQ